MKPTIKELEEIMDQEGDQSITILPNGEITVKGKKIKHKEKPITMKENLGSEY